MHFNVTLSIIKQWVWLHVLEFVLGFCFKIKQHQLSLEAACNDIQITAQSYSQLMCRFTGSKMATQNSPPMYMF